MKVGSLFSGIGGLDLGLERVGMTVVWQSEIDPYCCRVLNKHWPHVPNLGDITGIDWSTVEPVDLICGGYPCQPFSLAGVRRGEADPRHLWPHFADAIRVLRPRFAVLENVPGHLSLGFGRVLGDLAELGYDADWDCIPAAAVGAPHLRYRIFVIAHASRTERGRGTQRGSGGHRESRVDGEAQLVADADGHGHGRTQDARRVGRVDDGDAAAPWQWQRSRPIAVDRGTADVAHADRESESGFTVDAVPGQGIAVPDADRGRRGQRDAGERRLSVANAQGHGVVDWWATEPDVGRVADGVPARVDRLRALGNAVVPQVAEWVGRRIMEADAA